ncbi:MAG TPA: hypothetical protein DCZ95_13165 [Verrucomicrobia bacterium]|nr:MAG: hypothetical protein A2X46_11510 [Lentisphaerae bacterium GWF2_57_35]HBA85037.1 hypothetical protein [Verrucomicrobiota bacterium]
MATIFKREGSPYYYARFQVRGKDCTLSTEKTNRNEALDEMRRMLAEKKGQLSLNDLFETLLREFKRQYDAATQDHRRVLDEKRQEFVRRITHEQQDKLSIQDAWQAWLNNPKKRNPSQTTVDGYETQWTRFKAWAEKKGIQYLHEVLPVVVEEYAQDLWTSKVSPGTYNAHIRFLKSMFKILKIQAGLVSNPWEELPFLELERESRRNLTPKELAAVCKAAKGTLRYMIGIGLYTGMRLGDVVNLRWDEVDLKEGIIEHMPMKTARKKKKVRLPIHPVLDALLKELKEASERDYLFPKERIKYSKDNSTITKQIQKFFEDCGIETNEKATNGHRKKAIVRVGFHSLRHSFVSLCAANNVPQVAIMDLVGHGSPAMTRLYSHAGTEQKAKAIAALPTLVFNDEA